MTVLCENTTQEICDQTLVLILAGGQGSRLFELTESRAKPGLEFGGNYRIIDFPLSNCANSGLKHIGVVTQYKSQGLIHHLIQGWAKSNQEFGHSFELLPASQQHSTDWYRGTADALFQNIEFIRSVGAKYVLVLSGDHIYKMDYRSMLSEHVNSQADLSVACIEVPVSDAAGQFGVMGVDGTDRVTSFVEKPLKPEGLADAPGYTLASMGNYVFNTDFLIEQLYQDASERGSDHDFGKNIIPALISAHHVQAHRFRDKNRDTVPYWRDVGTLDSYWLSNMALLTSSPDFDLYEKKWPIWCEQASMPPAKFVTGQNGLVGTACDSLISNGCTIEGGRVNKSLLFPEVEIKEEAFLDECLMLPNSIVGKKARLRRVIVDRSCHIPDNFEAGIDLEQDQARGFRVSPGGIVLITQKMLDKLAKAPELKKTHKLGNVTESVTDDPSLTPASPTKQDKALNIDADGEQALQ